MSDIEILAAELVALYRKHGLRLAVAESCTGGMIASAVTSIPGSSNIFDRGFITYSNQAKSDMLSVPADLLAKYGAVSEQVAGAMAEGALAHSVADCSVAVTGIAGPDGGSAEKPVGLVHITASRRHSTTHHRHLILSGDRQQIRTQAARQALEMLIEIAAD